MVQAKLLMKQVMCSKPRGIRRGSLAAGLDRGRDGAFRGDTLPRVQQLRSGLTLLLFMLTLLQGKGRLQPAEASKGNSSHGYCEPGPICHKRHKRHRWIWCTASSIHPSELSLCMVRASAVASVAPVVDGNGFCTYGGTVRAWHFMEIFLHRASFLNVRVS